MLIVLLGAWQGAVGGDAAAPLIRLVGGGGVQRGNRKENETVRGKLNGKWGELCVMISHICRVNPARRAEGSLEASAGRG